MVIPEQPQFCQERRVLLGFFWGRLRGLFVLQTQPLDLLQDLSEAGVNKSETVTIF